MTGIIYLKREEPVLLIWVVNNDKEVYRDRINIAAKNPLNATAILRDIINYCEEGFMLVYGKPPYLD